MSNEATQYLQWAIPITIVGSAVFFNWRLGLWGATKNLIDVLKGQNEAKDKIIDELQAENKQLIADAATNQGKMEEKDKTIAKITAILQGRDEQTQQFQKEGFEAIKRGRDTYDILRRIEEHLKIRSLDSGSKAQETKDVQQ